MEIPTSSGRSGFDRARSEPRYATTRDAARTEATEVQRLVGEVLVDVQNAPPGVRVVLDGADLPTGAWGVPTPFDPRGVEVTASAPGYLPFRDQIRVDVGRRSVVAIHLADAPRTTAFSTDRPITHPTARSRGDVRRAGIAVAAVGAATGIVSGVLYLVAWNRYNTLQMSCSASIGCDPSLNPSIDEGARFQTLSWAFGGGAVALIAVAAAMIAVGGPHEIHPSGSGRDTARGLRAWTLWATQLSLGSGGIAGVAGRF